MAQVKISHVDLQANHQKDLAKAQKAEQLAVAIEATIAAHIVCKVQMSGSFDTLPNAHQQLVQALKAIL